MTLVTTTYDLVAIGSGPAGQRAAVQAAKLGKRAAVVERRSAGRRLRQHRHDALEDAAGDDHGADRPRRRGVRRDLPPEPRGHVRRPACAPAR